MGVRRAAAVLAAVVTMLVAAVLPGGRAGAAITTAFTTRFDANTNGSILLRGNSNLTCPAAATGCAAGRNGTGSLVNDNDFAMVYTNADGDPATFNDSAATITLPAGSTVLFAGLYWGADATGAPAPALKDRVLLRTPAGPAWSTVTASTLSSITGGAYQGFADVSALVAGGGDGSYSVANIQAGTGTDKYGGWALAVAYRNPAEDMRSLRIYDGFGSITSGSVNIPVTGFETPHSGVVHARVGAVAYEGDFGKTGDSLLVDGQTLSDAQNPPANFFNSTVSDAGAAVSGRDPGYPNLMGVDIDQVDATGVFGHGATSATVTLTTAGETYYPGVITFTIDLYAPKITTTVTGTDVNGGDLLPGDEIEYRIAVRNDGSDTADDVTLADVVPPFTSYKPGSLTVQGTPVTDASGDDQGWYGSGAAGWSLGSIPYLGTTYVTFRVRVALTAPAGYAITNLLNVSYTGRTTSVAVAGLGGAVATPVLPPHADLAAGLTVVPPAVQRAAAPTAVTYTATVTNAAGDLEPTAAAVLTLPAGVVPGALPAGCTTAGQTVTCPLGPLVAGSSNSVAIPAVAGVTTAANAVATLRATGGGSDGNPANDTDTAVFQVNSPPVAVDDAASTTAGTPVTVQVLANDADPDDPAAGLTVSIVTAPAHGTVVVEADQSVRYTPAAGWAGADTFGYQVDDPHGGSDTATATVTTANAPPTATDDMAGTPSATPVTITVLANDTDPNGDPLTVTAVASPPAGVGSVVLAGGQITFTPAPAFAGRAAFTYTIRDPGGASATGDVFVDVANAAPTAADDIFTTAYPAANVLLTVLVNDTDPNGDTLTVTAVGAADHGSAVADPLGIRYQAPAGFSGTATFSYTISDGLSTSTAQVSVTVADAVPVAAGFARTIAYGTGLSLDVLAAASDPNGDPLRVAGTTDPAHGTVARNPDGTLTYTPATGFSGADGFAYTIDDGRGGTATATVTVSVGNGVATARDDAATGPAGAPVVIAVLANDDGDPNGDPLTVTVDVPPGHGGFSVGADLRVTYTPAAGFTGTDTFHYVLNDGLGGTSGATVTVTVVNTAPVCRPDAASTDTDTATTVPVLANDDDPNGDPLRLIAATDGGFGTVTDNGDGTLTYVPESGFYGTDSFVYSVADPAGLTDSAIVTVTVRDAAPIAVDDRFDVRPGVTVTLAVLANDHDPNAGQAIRVASVGPAVLGTAVLNPDGTVSYRAGDGSFGADSFGYVLTDDVGRTDQATVTIRIDGAPVATDDDLPAAGGTAVDVPVTANDTDPENEQLTVTSVGTPGHGTAHVNPDGTILYTPVRGFLGTDTFPYVVADTAGNTATGHVVVRVANTPPVARPDWLALLSDRTALVNVLANDGDDNPGQTLTVLSAGAAGHGTTAVAGNLVRYVPATGWTGRDTFTYAVGDGQGGTATGTVTVTVSSGTPVAVPDSGQTPFQRPVTLRVLDNDLDPGRSLAVTAVTQPARGAVTFSAAAVTYTPPAGFAGTGRFTYTATDDAGHRTSAEVTVVVGVPPAVPDRAVTTKPGTQIGIVPPRTDFGGRPVTIRWVGVPAHGSAVLNADGTVTYTPDPGFTGVDRFTYEVVDEDGNVAQASIIVTVPQPSTPTTPAPTSPAPTVPTSTKPTPGPTRTSPTRTVPAPTRPVPTRPVPTTPTTPPADRAPLAADDAAIVVAGDTVVLRPTLNDRDPDGDRIVIVAVGRPRHGTASAGGGNTVTYASGAAFAAGVDSFGYTIADGHGRTAAATVTVRVIPAAALPTTGRDGLAVARAGLIAVAVGGLLRWSARLADAERAGRRSDPPVRWSSVTGLRSPCPRRPGHRPGPGSSRACRPRRPRW